MSGSRAAAAPVDRAIVPCRLPASRFLLLLAVVVTALFAEIARADGQADQQITAVRQRDRSWSVRGDAFVLGGAGILGPTAGAVGLTVQKILFERWAWEETAAWGMGNRHLDGKDTGLTLAGTLRFAALRNDARTQALTVALGDAFILGGGYGRMHFLYAELGYAYRGPRGFNALVALGPDWLYAASGRGPCIGAGDWSCRDFRAGDFAAVGHVRAGLGWSF